MSNLALTKQRKFTSGMNRRYMLIFSNPVSGMNPDELGEAQLHIYSEYAGEPTGESQIAGNLVGIVSQQTQLSVLSCVDNVQQEIEQIKQDEEDALTDGYPMNRDSGGARRCRTGRTGRSNSNSQRRRANRRLRSVWKSSMMLNLSELDKEIAGLLSDIRIRQCD